MMGYQAWAPLAYWPLVTLPDEFAAAQGVNVARWSDRGYLSRTSDAMPNKLYEARLMGDVEISQSIVDALTVGNAIATTISEIELWNGDEALNNIAANGGMDGRAIVIKSSQITNFATSDCGGALDNAVVVWRGIVTRVDVLGLRARIAMNDLSGRLDTLLVGSTYDGLGGLGGIEELKGQRKPVSVGYRFNVQPTYIGLVDLGDGMLPTYQTHYRSMRGHLSVRIRGVEQVSVGNAPGIGQYVDRPSNGCFQLGGSADGQVNCDVEGDNVGSYKRSLTDILRFILLDGGPGFSESDLDAQSWFELGGSYATECGWGHGTEPITGTSALNTVLSSVGGGFMHGTRAGKLAVGCVCKPSVAPRVFLTLPDIIKIEQQTTPASVAPTPQAVQVRAARNWHVVDDPAGSVTADEAARLNSTGALARSFSNQIAARSVNVREFTVEGLYRFEADALARAVEIRQWLERGLRLFEVTTDRYLGVVEIGMTVSITYPYYGLTNGWSGIIVGWSEQMGARRLTMQVLG